MTNKQLIEAVRDLADNKGMTPEQYILRLVKSRNDAEIERTKKLPDDAKREVYAAAKAKSEANTIKKRDRAKSEMEEDISLFRKYFPDVTPDMIPDAVWEEVSKGVALVHAYALYLKAKENESSKAEAVNTVNDSRAVPAGNDGSSGAQYTKEEVEQMTPQAVKGNYKKILSSIKNWKL